MFQKIKGWRTIIFNVLMTPLSLMSLWGVDAGVGAGDVEGLLNQFMSLLDGAEAFFITLQGLGNMVLRAITSTPIFNKDG